MSHPMIKLIGVVFLAAYLFAGAKAANAFEITQAIPNTNQTACMDVEGNKTASGTTIQAFPCTGGFNEQWNFLAGNLEGLGTAGSVANCANPDGAETGIVLSECDSPDVDEWLIQPSGQINFFGQARFNCLDSQSQYGSGAQIAIDSCSSASSQVWVLRDIVIAQAIPNSDQHACADVQGQAIANGTPVNAYPCTFGPNERWTYINGQLQGIGTSKSQSTCLGTETTGGVVQAVLQTCNSNNPGQQWWLATGYTSSGGSGSLIYNSGLKACLDSQGQYGNAQLVITSCLTKVVPASALWVVH